MQRKNAASGEQERVGTEDLLEAGKQRETAEKPTGTGAAGETIPRQDRGAAEAEEAGARLFSDEEITRFRGKWDHLQTTFVDEPRQAVQEADELVAQVMQTLASTFAEHKQDLENQWHR